MASNHRLAKRRPRSIRRSRVVTPDRIVCSVAFAANQPIRSAPCTRGPGIDTFLYLLDEVFRGVGIEESNESQALLPNLRSVPDGDWHLLPEGAARSIESIAVHVGATKLVYGNHAFGDATSASTCRRSSRGGPARRRCPTFCPGWNGHDGSWATSAALADDTELDDRGRPTGASSARPAG